jgi:glycerophosphoryl diester phosphodiesterase
MRLAVLLLAAMAGTLMAAAPIQVHGHRGARATRPENTIPAFEYAIGIGADVLEMDVAVTKDDVLVISHDARLNPTICTTPAGSRVIHQLTLAELRKADCGTLRNPGFPKQQPVPGTRIPTLDEVLSVASRTRVGFNIETKINPKEPDLTPDPETFAKLMLEALRRHKVESRAIVQSFDYRTLQAMKKLDPKIQLSALFDNKTQEDFVSIAKRAGAGIVSPHFSLVTPEKVKAAHDAGLQVVPWTANTPDAWQKLADAKVDAIITDDPAALIAWLKSKSLR